MYKDIDRCSRMNKKGVSPVIAVLLLIVIAVAAAILTYLWITGYMGTVQQQGGTQQLQERIKVEGVDLSGSYLDAVYVRNVGDVQVTVNSIYLILPSGEAIRVYTGSTNINPKTVSRIDVTNTALTSGTTYIVKVTTSTGIEATYTFTYRA